MLSKAIFIHSHINLAYKSPFIIRDLRSRTITAAARAKDAVRVRSVTQLEQHTLYFKINCGIMQCGLCGISKKLQSIAQVS